MFLLLVLAVVACSALGDFSVGVVNSIVDSRASFERLASNQYDQLEGLRRRGVNSVELLVPVMQDLLNSSNIGASLFADDLVVRWMRVARLAGLEPVLKLSVSVVSSPLFGFVKLCPSDPVSWFADYQAWVVHYANMSNAEGATRFIIGLEMATLTANASLAAFWPPLIAAARNAFPNGRLTYASLMINHPPEFSYVPFWPLLDSIGIDAYVPLATDPSQPMPSAAAAAAAALAWFKSVRTWRATAGLAHLNVTLTEFGVPSHAFALVCPFVMPYAAGTPCAKNFTLPGNCSELADANVQAFGMSAMVKAIAANRDMLDGFFLFAVDAPGTWDYVADFADGKASHSFYACSFTWRGKTATEEIVNKQLFAMQ